MGEVHLDLGEPVGLLLLEPLDLGRILRVLPRGGLLDLLAAVAPPGWVAVGPVDHNRAGRALRQELEPCGSKPEVVRAQGH